MLKFFLNLNSIMLGSQNPEELASFYTKILNRRPDIAYVGYYGWQVGACFLSIGEHSEIEGKSIQPQRILLNFQATDVIREYERMVAAGAIVIKEPYEVGDEYIATLADIDGNYFQLMSDFE